MYVLYKLNRKREESFVIDLLNRNIVSHKVMKQSLGNLKICIKTYTNGFLHTLNDVNYVALSPAGKRSLKNTFLGITKRKC